MSRWIDRLSEFFAQRKGLIPLVGMLLVVVNFILQFTLPSGDFLVTSNLFLHLGVILAVFGLLLAWAL